MAIRMDDTPEIWLMEPDDERWLTTGEAAVVLDMSRDSVVRYIKAGMLTMARVRADGNLAAPIDMRTQRRVEVASLRALIQRMGNPPRMVRALDTMVEAKWIEGNGRAPRKRRGKADAE